MTHLRVEEVEDGEEAGVGGTEEQVGAPAEALDHVGNNHAGRC